MPQASDEMRALMLKWFGDEISEAGPIKFLESRGYVLRKDWQWQLPTPAHTVSREEFACVQFLIEEWDFGALVDPALEMWDA